MYYPTNKKLIIQAFILYVCMTNVFLVSKKECLENTDLENADLENADLENADLGNLCFYYCILGVGWYYHDNHSEIVGII